jgi:hypothetical protein
LFFKAHVFLASAGVSNGYRAGFEEVMKDKEVAQGQNDAHANPEWNSRVFWGEISHKSREDMTWITAE